MVDLTKHIIEGNANIREAFKKLNDVPASLTLFVTNGNGQMLGTLSDGDIRRGFLNGLKLTDAVEQFMSHPFHF